MAEFPRICPRKCWYLLLTKLIILHHSMWLASSVALLTLVPCVRVTRVTSTDHLVPSVSLDCDSPSLVIPSPVVCCEAVQCCNRAMILHITSHHQPVYQTFVGGRRRRNQPNYKLDHMDILIPNFQQTSHPHHSLLSVLLLLTTLEPQSVRGLTLELGEWQY